jgi:hypothetical protein
LPNGIFYDVCPSAKRKFVRLFQVSQSHTRKKSDLFPSSNASLCRFLASAFIFLNQYNVVHEVLCVLYAFHLSFLLPPSPTFFLSKAMLCVQSKMIKLSIFIYFFPFLGSLLSTFCWRNDGTVSCCVSSFRREKGRNGMCNGGEVKICKMYTDSRCTSQKKELGRMFFFSFHSSHKCPSHVGHMCSASVLCEKKKIH